MTDTRKAPERIWAEERDAPCIYYDTSVKNSGKYQVEYIRANLATPDLTAAAEAMAEALKEANSAVNNAYEMAYAEWNNHDRRGAKLGDKIGDWRAKQKDALAQYNAMLAEREKSYD